MILEKLSQAWCCRAELHSPYARGKGYGRMQIEEVLRIFKEKSCKKVTMTTGESDFFFPARRMYESLGFRVMGRNFEEKWGFRVVAYEKKL